MYLFIPQCACQRESRQRQPLPPSFSTCTQNPPRVAFQPKDNRAAFIAAPIFTCKSRHFQRLWDTFITRTRGTGGWRNAISINGTENKVKSTFYSFLLYFYCRFLSALRPRKHLFLNHFVIYFPRRWRFEAIYFFLQLIRMCLRINFYVFCELSRS